MITRERELAEFQIRWLGKPKKQVVEELSSYFLETRLIPDPYYFTVNAVGQLISPETELPIENSIEKDSPLGFLEYQGFVFLQNWAAKNEEGVAVWISPPHPERSELTKIIVSELFKDSSGKRILNYAIRLNLTTRECLELARNLPLIVPFNKETVDTLRATILFLDLQGRENWLTTLSSRISQSAVWRLIEGGESMLIKEQAKQEAARVIKDWIVLERFFGSYPSSCPPPGAFDTIFRKSNFVELSFPCPKCEKPIPSGKGITVCPHCGAKKEDFEKCD